MQQGNMEEIMEILQKVGIALFTEENAMPKAGGQAIENAPVANEKGYLSEFEFKDAILYEAIRIYHVQPGILPAPLQDKIFDLLAFYGEQDAAEERDRFLMSRGEF
jgi:hypothetical protein